MKHKKILDTGRVQRYHASMVDKKQSIAEHAWGVAVLMYLENPCVSREALLTALFHDCGEIFTGDIPSPMKRLLPPDTRKVLKHVEREYMESVGIPDFKISEYEENALKIADCLEGLYFCEARFQAGDKEALPIRDAYVRYLGELNYVGE